MPPATGLKLSRCAHNGALSHIAAAPHSHTFKGPLSFRATFSKEETFFWGCVQYTCFTMLNKPPQGAARVLLFVS
jgi:hypothetical protein